VIQTEYLPRKIKILLAKTGEKLSYRIKCGMTVINTT